MKLYISEPHERHAGPILIHDDDHNDIAEFFHNEEGTVGQSYETALMLANRLVGDAAPDNAAHFTAELLRIKNRFDTIFNNVLCDMKPGWDDSIEGFNKAWDIARDIFQEEIGRAAGSALSPSVRIEGSPQEA